MKTRVQRHARPDRTEVRDSNKKWLATMTDGAYTVTLAGPVRTFSEPRAAHPVMHGVWVRTLPAPFDGKVNSTWLNYALKANKQAVPDGTRIDQVGMYLGQDAGNHHRFISSRKGANGPTLGDYKGKSTLDGNGPYARSFRTVRRL